MTAPSSGHTAGQRFSCPHSFFVRAVEVACCELKPLLL
jgi:hypothetical protein